MEQFHNYGSVLGHGGLRRRSPLMRCRHDFSDQLPAPDEFCRSRQSLWRDTRHLAGGESIKPVTRTAGKQSTAGLGNRYSIRRSYGR